MFSTNFSVSKRDQRQQNQQDPSSLPPLQFSGRGRARSSLPRLSPSLSCPHLPLLVTGKSSPPAVTSAVAFGSTTPTSDIFWSVGGPKLDETPKSAGVRRLSIPGFPWEDRASSGRMSPAAELTGNIARRSHPVTPPTQLSHARSETAAGFKDKAPSKSSLRLELPAPRIDDPQIERRHSMDPNTCGRHRGFVGQPLLGLAYPTTPDIGLNSSPVMCGACKEGGASGHGEDNGGGGGNVVGGAAVAAQHVLLATGPHMGRGGLALLTPPDDNGILDWQQSGGGGGGIQPDGGGSPAQTISGTREFPASQGEGSAPTEQVKVNPQDGASPVNGSSPDTPNTTGSRPKPEQLSLEGGLADGEWIRSAMETLEAVRVLSYTLPCPLPDAPSPDVPTSSSSNPANPDRLPASAAWAPAVAAAAGQQLSPMVLARCNSTDGGVSMPARAADWGTTTALHHLTTAIQHRYLSEGTKRVYIHVSHAIDPQIPLTRLPSTPPITGSFSAAGGSESGEGSYFSPSVFNSIVIAPSSLGAPLRSHPQSAPLSNPILPPNSLHLTLLERYIPPASPIEDAAMFSTKSSILIDRLFELSPQGGSLLFIYPTKTGAMNFDSDYLGPVLDPLLRKLMVLYRLRQELMWGVRNMSSVRHQDMAEFPALHARLEAFCAAMTAGKGGLPRMPTKVVYASKAMVSLNELSWREWWTQQEQLRIREIVKRYGTMQPAPGSVAATGGYSGKGKETESRSGFWQGYGVPGDLAREILDGVRAPTVRPSSRGMGEAVLASSMSGSGGGVGSVAPVGVGRIAGGIERLETMKTRGVEVGIFILRRGLDS